MEEGLYDFLGQLEEGQAGTTRPQYSLTRPQFNPLSQPPPRRDRYRAQHRRDEVYDIPDDGSQYNQSDEFDSFDRQRQAELGHARLSFPPKASKPFVSAPVSQVVPLSRATHRDSYHNDGQHEQYPRLMRDLSQFAYNATQPDASSEPQLGASSSPAFKASQRRAETHHANLHRPPPQLPHRNEFRTPEPPERRSLVPIKRASPQPAPNRREASQAPPVIQGIPLVPITDLPDRLRTVFPYPTFNAVQSRCFDQVFRCDDNFVLASPTGSGKTAILELAVCRAFTRNASGQYKIVYQAPIKALCSERQRDWQKKFSPLGLNCVELTGDSDSANLKHVQTADIIVTTPEKWDSITRKWKDHERLMRLIKLFLIDEVHILKEDRGAILEAVVSRMKTIGTDVRFVALSATVPNLDDVASWLGKTSAAPYHPANSEKFGEEFRPVKLTKHVCGYSGNTNDFAFESSLDHKLPEVIAKYSERKPIMIFCMTRNSTVSTAKMLALWWSANVQRRYWSEPSKPLNIQNQELRNCVASGVAFHHAGLDAGDRLNVEKAFLEGDVNVICCTSTLAVGVNLPCHFVIIKHTVTWTSTGAQEYSDLEIMQMIGRAGRPQFDNSAVAVIMTRQAKVRRYETMVTGQEVLESKLHHGLIEHLNAEIGLGTIRDLASARNWLSKTFLYVRIKQNPSYYKLEGARSGQHIDEQLDDICLRDLALLQGANLVADGQRFKCTDFGEAMARYYVNFETMRIIVGLQPGAQISEILSALSQASEFQDIRFRSGEKPFYKTLNSSPSIRFPIPVSLNLPAHKVSLIIQSVLGSADTAWDKDAQKHRAQYQNEVAAVFKHVHRLIRCIADCQISLGDSRAVMNALLLQRSLRAQAWDDGPLHMRQIPEIGVVAVRKLVTAGIRTIEELEFSEPHRIEMVLKRNPPFGLKLLEQVRLFPKLRVSIQVLTNTTRQTEDGVKNQLKVEIGFLNEKPVTIWRKQSVYVCLLVATSDGRMAHFARISGQKLGTGQDLIIPATLKGPDESVNCYVMCDEIAGTMREATVKPRIAPSMFPAPKPETPKVISHGNKGPASNTSKRRIESTAPARKSSDDFDDGLDDDDLVSASFKDLEFDHIENYANPTTALTRKNTAMNKSKDSGRSAVRINSTEEGNDEPRQLENGKWACNHRCKDKTSCKHICCREGLDKPPIKKAAKKVAVEDPVASQGASKKEPTQTKLQLSVSKRKSSADIEVLDLTQNEKKRKSDFVKNGPREIRNLHQLHKKIQRTNPPASISAVPHKKPAYCYSVGGEHNLSFMGGGGDSELGDTAPSTDYGDLPTTGSTDYGDFLGDCQTADERLGTGRGQGRSGQSQDTLRRHNEEKAAEDRFADQYSDNFGDDDSLLEDVMVGVADSQDMQAVHERKEESLYHLDPDDFETDTGNDVDHEDHCVTVSPDTGLSAYMTRVPPLHELSDTSPSTVKHPTPATADVSPHFLHNLSSGSQGDVSRSAKSVSRDSASQRLNQEKSGIVPRTIEPPKRSAWDENEELVTTNLVPTPNRNNAKQESLPDPRYKDLEPWLFQEFGDIVELVDE